MSFYYHKNSPQASVRCPIVKTTASWSCGSMFGLDNRHNSAGMTLNFDKEDANCSETGRQKKWRIQYKPVVLVGWVCMCLTIVRDAGRECFSDYCSHLTSRSTVCWLRQHSGKSVWEWIQASHWHKILLSTSWKTHICMRAHNVAYVSLFCCCLCSRLFATVMPINEHIGCASSALGNATSCSQVFTRGNTYMHAFWFSSVKNNAMEDCSSVYLYVCKHKCVSQSPSKQTFRV